MNKTILCEVMLRSYKDLEAKCELIESRAVRYALSSMNKDIYTCAETLLSLNNEKITLCNVKVVVDEAVKNIGRNAELKAFYLDGTHYMDIIQQEHMSLRTFFRRAKIQKERLCEAIQERYSDECLFELVRGSRWLFDRYHKAVRRAEDARKRKSKGTNDQKPKTAQVGK
nr:MAG TPA: hypothetical protein [Caudoviricetes sp.]